MRWLLILLAGVMMLSGCVQLGETQGPGHKTGFCGSSTYGPCSSDVDCVRGGCSNQYCHSTSEDPPITTCEYRECYSAGEYGVECACVEKKCQWR